MKPVLLGILTLVLFNSISGLPTADLRRYKALKFGSSLPDYIIYKPNMGPLQNDFSVCSWVRGLRSSGYPSWLSYAVVSAYNEIMISSNGERNFVFDENLDLTSEMDSVPLGTWYHYCYTWSMSSRTQKVYLNGQVIGSRLTSSGRNLGTNGYLVIGNDQDSHGGGMTTEEIFGGELYKLNFYSKELSRTEVLEMARDKCTDVEETYGAVRSIKWEDILLKTRNGDVTEIDSGCTVSRQEMSPEMNATLAELEQTKSDLEKKEEQLNTTEAQKQTTIKELNNTTKELKITTASLNRTLTELEEVKRLLEVATNTTCQANTTISSHWDLLYSEKYYREIFTTEKLEVLRKSIKKLGQFIALFCNLQNVYLLIFDLQLILMELLVLKLMLICEFCGMLYNCLIDPIIIGCAISLSSKLQFQSILKVSE